MLYPMHFTIYFAQKPTRRFSCNAPYSYNVSESLRATRKREPTLNELDIKQREAQS